MDWQCIVKRPDNIALLIGLSDFFFKTEPSEEFSFGFNVFF